MARNAARRELRSFESSERNQRVKEGFRFAGAGAASVWTYPLVLILCFVINAFTTGLPEFEKNNAAMGAQSVSQLTFFYASMVPGAVLAVAGIFLVKGRWWSIVGGALTWFLNPYTTMLLLLPTVSAIPGWFSDLTAQLFSS